MYSLIYPRSKGEALEIQYTRFEKYAKRISSSFDLVTLFAESSRTMIEFHVEIIL